MHSPNSMVVITKNGRIGSEIQQSALLTEIENERWDICIFPKHVPYQEIIKLDITVYFVMDVDPLLS